MGGVGGRHAPKYCEICKKVGQKSKVRKAAGDLVTIFFVTFFFLAKVVGQLVTRYTPSPPHPIESVSVHHWSYVVSVSFRLISP